MQNQTLYSVDLAFKTIRYVHVSTGDCGGHSGFSGASITSSHESSIMGLGIRLGALIGWATNGGMAADHGGGSKLPAASHHVGGSSNTATSDEWFIAAYSENNCRDHHITRKHHQRCLCPKKAGSNFKKMTPLSQENQYLSLLWGTATDKQLQIPFLSAYISYGSHRQSAPKQFPPISQYSSLQQQQAFPVIA
ncbi:hypothetical protein STEG23_031153 [Scotinomys teguina]